MAMMIAKFHKLIQSRILWIIFLFIVVVSFVFVTAPNSARSAAQRKAMIAGEINGMDIDRGDFDVQRRMMSFSLRDPAVSGDKMNDLTWKRIAMLQEAEGWGIKVTSAEVQSAIQQAFQEDGQFNQEAFDKFLYMSQKQFGLGLSGIYKFIHQELTLDRLRRLILSNTLITPYESKRLFKTFNDVFTIDFITLSADFIKDEVTISEEELLDYYDAHQDTLIIPEQVKVRYISIPFDNYTNDFTNIVEELEENALAIYSNNQDRFVKELEPETEGTNDPALSLLTTNMTFEEAKPEILSQLLQEKARTKAMDAGSEISITVMQENSDFDAVCEERGLEVLTSPFFTENGIVPGIDTEVSVGTYAFTLTTNEDERVSDVLLGSNAAYVIYLVEKQSERLPLLEEIRERVQVEARYYYIQQKLSEKADELRTSILHALQEGLSFTNATSDLAYTLQTSPPFSLAGEELQIFEYGPFLDRDIGNLQPGDLSEIITIPNGKLIYYVTKREDADWGKYEDFRERIITSYIQQVAPILLNDYQKYLLEKGNFESKLVDPEKAFDEELEEETQEAS